MDARSEDRGEPPPAATAEELGGAIARAAELWGASWTPERPSGCSGRLRLGVAAGLRRGVLTGRLSCVALDAEEAGRGGESSSGAWPARLRFEVEESSYRLHRPTLIFALLGGAGGVTLMLLPFLLSVYPAPAAQLAPIAMLLLVGGWFATAARPRGLALEDFIALVYEEVEAAREG